MSFIFQESCHSQIFCNGLMLWIPATNKSPGMVGLQRWPCTGCPCLNMCHSSYQKVGSGDFPGGPVVNNLPSNAGNVGSIPD